MPLGELRVFKKQKLKKKKKIAFHKSSSQLRIRGGGGKTPAEMQTKKQLKPGAGSLGRGLSELSPRDGRPRVPVSLGGLVPARGPAEAPARSALGQPPR